MSPTGRRRLIVAGRVASGPVADVHMGLLEGAVARQVAVKVLRAPFATDPRVVEAFRRGCAIQQDIVHPGVMGVVDVSEHDARPCAILPKADALPAASWLRGGDGVPRALPLVASLSLAHEVLEVLEAVHSLGVAHGQLRPANLWVDARGRVQVSDICPDRPASAAPSPWTSPEQAVGDSASAPSDLFAVGALLYEGLTGLSLLPASPVAALAALDGFEIGGRLGALPGLISQVVARLLSRDPAERGDAAAAREEIRRAAAVMGLDPGPTALAAALAPLPPTEPCPPAFPPPRAAPAPIPEPAPGPPAPPPRPAPGGPPPLAHRLHGGAAPPPAVAELDLEPLAPLPREGTGGRARHGEVPWVADLLPDVDDAPHGEPDAPGAEGDIDLLPHDDEAPAPVGTGPGDGDDADGSAEIDLEGAAVVSGIAAGAPAPSPSGDGGGADEPDLELEGHPASSRGEGVGPAGPGLPPPEESERTVVYAPPPPPPPPAPTLGKVAPGPAPLPAPREGRPAPAKTPPRPAAPPPPAPRAAAVPRRSSLPRALWLVPLVALAATVAAVIRLRAPDPGSAPDAGGQALIADPGSIQIGADEQARAPTAPAEASTPDAAAGAGGGEASRPPRGERPPRRSIVDRALATLRGEPARPPPAAVAPPVRGGDGPVVRADRGGSGDPRPAYVPAPPEPAPAPVAVVEPAPTRPAPPGAEPDFDPAAAGVRIASLTAPAQAGKLVSDDVRFLRSVPAASPSFRASRLLLLTHLDRNGDKEGHCRATKDLFDRPEHRNDPEVMLEMAKCHQSRKQYQSAVNVAEDALRNIQSMPRSVRYGGTVTLLEVLARSYRSLWSQSARNLAEPDETLLDASIRYWEKLELAAREDWRKAMARKEIDDLKRRQEGAL
ncbi:protein kinase [Myxococcota bacterium]|nr:protein kinase [Myxococcota bacterium]